MLTKVNTFKTNGIQPVPVIVETEISKGIGIHLVGLADNAVKESLLRIVTALQSLGYRIPGQKIVINLAPADLRKSGAWYDLPIALAILSASGQERLTDLDKYIIAGELSLDGRVREVAGWMQLAELATQQGKTCIMPKTGAQRAVNALGDAEHIIGVETLPEVVEIIKGWREVEPIPTDPRERSAYSAWDSLRGRGINTRALEIAAAGGHPLLLVGTPEAGRATLARALSEILPPMTSEQQKDVQRIRSVVGLDEGVRGERPFRAPHYAASLPAMLGGAGEDIRPGEVSLAHNGVLFLDDCPSVPKSITEALRGPVEDGAVTISRLKGKVTFPAKFHLVLGALPCPCGWYGDGDRCSCTPSQREAFLARLQGPLYDRVTMQVWVNGLSGAYETDSRDEVAERLARTRALQLARQGKTNDELAGSEVCNLVCPVESGHGRDLSDFLANLIARLGLGVRSYLRILRIARTIADLEGAELVSRAHIAEASSYRFLDRTI